MYAQTVSTLRRNYSNSSTHKYTLEMSASNSILIIRWVQYRIEFSNIFPQCLLFCNMEVWLLLQVYVLLICWPRKTQISHKKVRRLWLVWCKIVPLELCHQYHNIMIHLQHQVRRNNWKFIWGHYLPIHSLSHQKFIFLYIIFCQQ